MLGGDCCTVGTPYLDIPDAHAAVHPCGAELRAVGLPARQHRDLAAGCKEAAGSQRQVPAEPSGLPGSRWVGVGLEHFSSPTHV